MTGIAAVTGTDLREIASAVAALVVFALIVRPLTVRTLAVRARTMGALVVGPLGRTALSVARLAALATHALPVLFIRELAGALLVHAVQGLVLGRVAAETTCLHVATSLALALAAMTVLSITALSVSALSVSARTAALGVVLAIALLGIRAAVPLAAARRALRLFVLGTRIVVVRPAVTTARTGLQTPVATVGMTRLVVVLLSVAAMFVLVRHLVSPLVEPLCTGVQTTRAQVEHLLS